jgi:hypothetical protein
MILARLCFALFVTMFSADMITGIFGVSQLDPSWTFYHGKKLLRESSTGSYVIKGDDSERLLVTFNYPGKSPAAASLEVRNEGRLIKSYSFLEPLQEDAFTPRVNTSAYFIIPLSDFANLNKGSVTFVYSDDNAYQNIVLGELSLSN